MHKNVIISLLSFIILLLNVFNSFREENIYLGFMKRMLLIRLNGVDTFLTNNCINV